LLDLMRSPYRAFSNCGRVWVYDSFEHRASVRTVVMKEAGWLPAIREFFTAQQTKVFLPAPFSPALEPHQVGPSSEICPYTLIPGAIPG
jgi:hypothetical protein